MTTSQRRALAWLRARNGTGVFDKCGVLLAAGNQAPFMRATWNALRDEGLIEIDLKRVRVTPRGYALPIGRDGEDDITARDAILYGSSR